VAEVQCRLGVRLRQTGNVTWAEKEQRAALAIAPDHPQVREELRLLTGLRMLGLK
jgi:hypothetical protein